MLSASTDVLVVGAGPAGSAAATVLARSGLDVQLVDRVEFPRWKVCGACLGPAALRALDGMGVGREVRARARPLTTLELRAGGAVARIALDDSATLSRAALDHVLAREAERAGARVAHGVRVERLEVENGAPGEAGVSAVIRMDGVPGHVSARAVVDASGLGGLRWVGHAVVGPPQDDPTRGGDVAPDSRIGVGAVYRAPATEDFAVAPEPGVIRMCVGGSGYVGSVVSEDGALTVAAALDPASLAGRGPAEAAAGVLDETGGRLPDAEPLEGWRGTPLLTRRDGSTHARVFRIGDASGYVEPFTGEGIGWALAAGLDVAPYVLTFLSFGTRTGASSLPGPEAGAAWAQAARAAAAQRQRVCRLVAAGLRRRYLTATTVRLLGHAPVLARPIVRLTGGR